jgi:signal peptidase II
MDVASKALALRWVPPLRGFTYPFGGIALFDLPCISFSLNTVVNTGMAWGLFPQFPTLLLILRLCIIGALVAYLVKRQAKATFALWLIVAGALGNVIDMFWYGCVIDFLHFRFFDWSFPIFNLADSLITIGAALLLLWPKSRAAFQGR